MAKNFRKRRDKKWKKKAKKKASLLSSSGCESDHYVSQSVDRSGSLKPIRRKVTKKGISNGCFELKKLTRNRVLVTNKKTGDRKVLSGNLKGGILL
ncbi:MAG: hypothetical protein U9R14_04930 [Patescibacteria group bacterium]|nr:hypothetical protein [Patescibacteria group bacterium]